MIQIYVNFWAVLVGAISSMIIGSIWYSPKVFGKAWMALIGKSESEMETMKGKATRAYLVVFIGSLITSYVLAHFAAYTNAKTVGQGMQLGFWIWLGFVATIQTGQALFQEKPFKLLLIDAGYYLVQLMVMGSLIALWM